MDSISKQQFVASIAYLLRETFEGSPEGQPSAYLDRGIGIFSTLDGISAADASRYIVRLTMQVEDRKGILADVSSRIAAINTNITNVEATGADSDHLGRINMAVEIKDVKHLEKVIKLLRGVDGVLDVERSAART